MAKNGLKGVNTQEDTEGTVEEKAGFGQKMKKMRDKLKLGPHHKMERFTVMLSVTMSFLLLFTAVSFAGHRVEVATISSEQSLISTDFTFSLTGQTGKVQGVFGDAGRTDVMVLFKLTDPKSMSADANNYELFITGEKDSITYEPDVSFSLFGATGYGVIRIENDTRLLNEVLDITIRANSTLNATAPVTSEDQIDGTFATFDQARIYVNPGADVITELEQIQPGEQDPSKIYTALVANTQDVAIHAKIDETTEKMSQHLKRAEEYTNRLVSTGFKAPETPWFIEGDYIDEDGNFHAASYLSKAHEIEYNDRTIWDGYLLQVTDNVAGFDKYITDMNAAAETTMAQDNAPVETVVNVKEIVKQDGTVIDVSTIKTGTSPSAQVAAKDSLDSLVATWRSYLADKSTLQRSHMMELLVLDADVLSQPELYSENTNEQSVWFY